MATKLPKTAEQATTEDQPTAGPVDTPAEDLVPVVQAAVAEARAVTILNEGKAVRVDN